MNVSAEIKNFGGVLRKLTHKSSVLGCEMKVNVFFPPGTGKVPVLFYLSGLTCTPDNCAEKGFFQQWAAKYNIAIVYPDTSPRGLDLPGEDDSYDFGSGAGFYLSATKEPYSRHYNMYEYITKELPSALFKQYSAQLDSERVSITGHSMGGHGALTLFLKNPGKYKSVSAFSPICNPSQCPWGKKAFEGYLESTDEWKEFDATELVKTYMGPKVDVLIDIGLGDNFYNDKQLLPENLVRASEGSSLDGNINVRFHEGYDHSYFFISTYAEDHVKFHAKYLNP